MDKKHFEEFCKNPIMVMSNTLINYIGEFKNIKDYPNLKQE